jgi:hypothetical protein
MLALQVPKYRRNRIDEGRFLAGTPGGGSSPLHDADVFDSGPREFTESLSQYYTSTNCQGTTFCTINYFSSLTECAISVFNKNRYIRSKIYSASVSRISNISATCCTRQTVQAGPSYRRMNVMGLWFTAASSASSIQCGTLTDLWHMTYTSTTFHRTKRQELNIFQEE